MRKFASLFINALIAGTLLFSASQLWAGDSGNFITGDGYICGLTTGSEIICWGDKAKTPPSGIFTEISSFAEDACGLKTDGSVVCWGTNTYGELIPPLETFSHIATGGDFSCGIKKSNNRVACWGDSSNGKTAPPVETFSQISLGNKHACGLNMSNNIVCWGYDGFGAVSEAPVGTFTQLSTTVTYYSGYYSSYESTTCALKSDQTVVCWGYDSTPSWLEGLTSITQISTPGGIDDNVYNSCILRTNGSAWCGGEQISGQFTYVLSGGSDYQCALESDGVLNCTGTASNGTIPAPSGYTFKQPGGVVIDPPSSCTQAELDAQYNAGYQAGLAAASTGATPVKLVNISTRAPILGGANNPIAGFIVSGSGTQRVMITAKGKGVPMNQSLVCQDATMSLYQLVGGSWTEIANNDDWQEDANAGSVPSNFQAALDPTDAALLRDLAAGTYTANMGCVSGTGIGLIGVNIVQ